MYQVVVPLHNNGRFGIFDVILSSVERANGEVTIVYYLHIAVNKNNLRAKMWWEKLFSTYRENK